MRRMLLIMLVGLVLQGCALPFGGKPTLEAAVQEEVNRHDALQPVTPPDIRLTREIPSGVIALVTYDAKDNNTRLKVTATYLFKRQWLGWTATGGGSSAQPVDQAPPPVDFSSFSGSSDGTNYAAAGGLVTDPNVQHIAVTFDDGSREVLPIEQGAYLAAKQDVRGVAQIEALGTDGQVLHSSEFITPPRLAPTVNTTY